MEALVTRSKNRTARRQQRRRTLERLPIDDEAETDDWENLSLQYSFGDFTILDGAVPAPPPEEPIRNYLMRGEEPEPPKATEKVKNMFVRFAHKVHYGWRVNSESNFNKKKPIFFLGKCYDCRQAHLEGGREALEKTVLQFKQDFTSRIWITYREGFSKISGSLLTSDSGWGCMVRSAQMILAQALVTHFLARDWTMFEEQSDYSTIMHKEIIRWFGDQPVQTSPFSLHRLVAIAKSIDRKPGEWYGASCATTLLAKASEIASDFVPPLKEICVYVGYDTTIYVNDVIDLATGVAGESTPYPNLSCSSPEWKSVVLLIPLALGVEDELCPTMVPCLKALFAMDNFLGVIGGTGKKAMYFMGFQGDEAIYLDPHYMQDAVDISAREFPLQSYHCVFAKKVSFSKLNSSCALGFYCRTRTDFEKFKDKVRPLIFPADGKHQHPIFDVVEGSRVDNYTTTSSNKDISEEDFVL